jgi:hypothetical protein
MLRHSPQLGNKPQLRELLLERNRNILAGLKLYKPDERALQLARICAPIEISLCLNQDVHQVRHHLALGLFKKTTRHQRGGSDCQLHKAHHHPVR